MSHTPGPWSWFSNPSGGARVHAQHEVGIADVLSRAGAAHPVQQTCEANARLIAAAPELCEAITKLVDIIETIRDGEGDVDTLSRSVSFTLQLAHAALKKAAVDSDPKWPNATTRELAKR